MIDPTAIGTVNRPSSDLRRHRGRKALSTHPPAPVDLAPRGSLKQRANNTSAPATLLSPDTADPRKTATWAWRKAETERRRRAAAPQPTLAPIDAFRDEYSTADDLAAAGLDADPDATGPRSPTIRGLLGGACAGWRVRPISVEHYDALRADNALAESVIGLYKTEVINRRGPWRTVEAVELATLDWVDWFNHGRLLAPIGNIPTVECEAQYYRSQDAPGMVAGIT